MNRTNDFAYSISKDGRFFMRTELRRGYDLPECSEATLLAKFPASEGYAIRREEHKSAFSSALVVEGKS